MATSFRKKGSARNRPPLPPGTRPSVQNSQLLVSTGVPSVDAIIGGGIAVGTILLIEDAPYGSYAKFLCKYFLAEGVVSRHALFVAAADQPPLEILQELPARIDNGTTSESDLSADLSQTSEGLKIAWRYQYHPKYQASTPEKSIRFGHFYDLSKTMNKSDLNDISVTTFDAARERNCVASLPANVQDSPAKLSHLLYAKLEESVRQTIEAGQFSTSSSVQERNILRIVVHSLGSPLWGMDDDQFHSLAKFLFYLKGCLRSAYAVALITLPAHLIKDGAVVRRLEHLCDTVVALESFQGSDKTKNPLYKDYHGLFHIRRLPRINSLTTHTLETLKWGFKLRRRKFSVEKLHLPPELSETANRAQEDVSNSGGLACQWTKAVARVKGKPLNALEF